MNSTSLLELALTALKHHVEQTRPMEQTSKAIGKLEAAIAEQAKPQEPAWYACKADSGVFDFEIEFAHSKEEALDLFQDYLSDHEELKFEEFATPLYTRPQALEPMSEDEIKAVHESITHQHDLAGDEIIAYARAIEAHHIGVKK